MPTTLNYFGGFSGRSEPIRSFAAAADFPLEFAAVSFETWPEKKPTTPFGSLPTLVLEDGLEIAQSAAILGFVAESTNKAGKNPKDRAIIRMVEETSKDTGDGWLFSELADEAKRGAAQTKIEGLLTKLDNFVGANHAVGGELTVADAVIWHLVLKYEFLFEGITIPPKLKAIANTFAALPQVAAFHATPEYPKAQFPPHLPFIKENPYLQKRLADYAGK